MEGPKISFVTWPDGKVSSESLTVAGERMARERLIMTWLPEEWFGRVEGYTCDRLWSGMEKKGFRSHTIEIGTDGAPVMSES